MCRFLTTFPFSRQYFVNDLSDFSLFPSLAPQWSENICYLIFLTRTTAFTAILVRAKNSFYSTFFQLESGFLEFQDFQI